MQRSILFLAVWLFLEGASPRRAEGQGKPAVQADTHQPRLMAQLGHLRRAYTVAFSPDGKQVLTGGSRTARLWDTATGLELRQFQVYPDKFDKSGFYGNFVKSMAFSPDGKYVLTGGGDGMARLFDAATGKESWRFPAEYSNSFMSVTFSPDGKQVFTGASGSTARLWDTASGRRIRALAAYNVESAAFSPDGKQVLTGDGLEKTARLWDAATAKERCRFQGHSGSVYSVAFGPDGKQVLTGSSDKTARLWDTVTGKELHRFLGHLNSVNSVAIAQNGKHVLTGSDDKTGRLWDATTGKELSRFQHSAAVMSVAISPGGKQVLTASEDGPARLWEAATGKELGHFWGLSEPVNCVAVFPGGKQVLTAGGKTARLWDTVTGTQQRRFLGHSDRINSVAISPDGQQVLTGSDDKTARLWDVATGKEQRSFLGHTHRLSCAIFSPDGRQVYTSSDDKTARLWDAATGKELRRILDKKIIASMALSPEGKQILMGGARAVLWDATTGKPLRYFELPPRDPWAWDPWDGRSLTCEALSPDGKQVLTGHQDKIARLWDAATGKELRRFRSLFGGHSDDILCVAFAPDGKQVLTGSQDRTARLWNSTTGQELRRFQGHSNSVTSVVTSPDGKQVLTGSLDQTVRLWDVAYGKELCRLVSFHDGSWAVVDSVGRFDASGGGDVEGLHWVVGNEPIALKQLKERYYDPGLLAKYMGFNKEPLRDVQAFRDVKLYPIVEADPPARGSSQLKLKLASQGGGIGKVQVFVNGRELLVDARGPKFDPAAATATMNVDLAGAVVVPGKKNEVRIVTWNSEGYLSSRSLDLDWEAPGESKDQPIELHAIVVGTSGYASDRLKLRFAAKDAADMARALELGGKRLFGVDKVHVTLLCDTEAQGDLAPTRANLEKAFEAAREARPTDVLVVYLAGHGIALQEQGQETYCYLTKEARSASRDAFRDPQLRRQYSLSSAELTEWFKKIPALKQVLILDTCAAGAAASKLIEHRDVSADQIRAIDRLRDRTGFHVLMGCASDRVSYEASQYSQGLLTYSLLQGMRGAKLRESEYMDVMELFQYAADQVPQLARHVGGIQKPRVLAPRGTSFDIGQLKEEDKKLIPLAVVRPLLLRPVLQNADENILDDDLKLMGRLRQRLSEETYAGARGPAVYLDADEMPGAVRPTGKYTVQGQTVHIRVLLRRDGQTVDTVQVEGSRNDLDGLANRTAAAILEKLKKP